MALILTVTVVGANDATAGTAAGAGSSATASVADETNVILVLGDSISAAYGIQREAGWVHKLNSTLAEREYPWTAINASISGETTGGGLARLPAILDQHEPRIVIIELGGNDGLRGYPTKKMADNLNQLVSLSEAAGAVPVIMAMRIPPNYGPRYTRDFEQAFVDVAEANQVMLIPFFLEHVALKEGMMQSDGIHPTAAAQDDMLAFVWDYLHPLLSSPVLAAAPPM